MTKNTEIFVGTSGVGGSPSPEAKVLSRSANLTLNNFGVSPDDFGAVGDAVTDDLDALYLALNEAVTRRVPLNLNKTYGARDVFLIEDVNGLVIQGSGGIRSRSAIATSVLEIKNCTSIVARPGLYIDGESRENIQSAVKVWASGSKTCSLHSLGFSVINATIGWQFGDFSAPENLLSEIVVHNGYTYNTPQPIVVIGAQAVIEVASYQLVSHGLETLASKAHVIACVYGSVLVINSGESLMPAVNTGFGFLSCPLESPTGFNSYGDIIVQGTSVENASIMFLAYNPRSVPSVRSGSGGLRMSGCRGYYTYSGTSFQGAADFNGKVIIDSTNNFFRGNTNTSKLASWQGPVEYYIDPVAFDDNWQRGLAGSTGGIAIFPYQKIFDAGYLAGAALNSGVSELIFKSVPAIPENSHFFECYNLSDGVFTVPEGGLKSVGLNISLKCSQPSPASSVQVYVNGAIFDEFGANAIYCNGSISIGDLSAGTTISVKYSNAAGAFISSGGSKDRITIYARR
ncbi:MULTISPECIES: hypothetical protein [unclassified Pseudomonas]|uniref:hypothetical protein n=1 Tax=unclassified Pseudomonas TaxID=196821 RepID=UPI0021C8430C|nr:MULTISPECIES: hypothetical protein [unclassified Pseudomonas]MCU1730609.1 hypothetical protein [Pseudomonas sp. 20P_3.2_Bac4]MCU1745458.1 hypothetical protein [Pseudomonas sp. 20P_3.2_Bac5]